MASQCFAARTSAIFVHGMVWCRVPTNLKLHDEHCISLSLYSWSIVHILEHEFFCLGHLGCAGSKGKKSGFEEF